MQAAAVRALGEVRRERVVGVDHRDAVGGQRVVDRALGVGDAEQAAHAFQVRRRDVVDQRDVGPRDRGRGRRCRPACRRPSRRSRTARLPARRAPPAAGRSRCCGCRGWRRRAARRACRIASSSVLTLVLPLLPVIATTLRAARALHAGGECAPARARCRRRRPAASRPRLRARPAARAAPCARGVARRGRGRRSARPSARRTSAAARHRACACRWRRASTSRRRRRSRRPPVHCAMRLSGTGLMRARSGSMRAAPRRRPWSSNGCRTPAISWYGSWPLPAISTMSLGAGLPTARAIAAARSRSTIDCVAAVAKPARMSATIASPSSLRGLSSVTMTRSARRSAIAAICGRLPRSRSPPQPNTQISRPRRMRAQRRQRLLQRIGRVRVVDDHQRLRRRRRRGGSCGRATGCSCASASAMASGASPSASSAPATASRLSTLKRPSSGERTAWRASPHRRRSKAMPPASSAMLLRAHVAPARRCELSADARACRRQRREQRAAEGVVDVDHRRAQPRPREQPRLGLRRRPPCRRGSRGGRA